MKEAPPSIVPLFFSSPAEFRKWLSKNHGKVDFAWLALKKKDSEKKCITYMEAVDEVLCYGWIDGLVKRYDNDNFIQRFTPRKANSVWSKINKDKALRLIKEKRMTEAGMKKIEEAKTNGMWEKAYSTEKKPAIPADLISSLKSVHHTWEAFSSFAHSHQNMYIHWVNDAKKEKTRKRRIKKVIMWSLEKKKPGML
jgi:uncharacterized protein YdeI (YjbR/CyaY-like superfamily)